MHLLSPSQIVEALATGLTTLGGGGTGPQRGHQGDHRDARVPGTWRRSTARIDPYPINLLLLGKGNTVSMEGLAEQALAGAGGYKVHEDWGSTPAAIDAALRAADEWGLQVALHSDSLNEAGYVASTIARHRRPVDQRVPRRGRRRRACAGHPDLAGLPNVIPGSTNPTLPHTVNTVAEHLDMLMVCHHLNPAVPEDLAFAESRIRATTIAAEDILHDMGAISMTSSDAQAMGRIGEVITRTWQVAHVMKARRGRHRRRAAGRQLPGPAVRREIHDQPGDRARHRPRDRLGGARQAGRPGAVGAEVLRHPAGRGDQGRRSGRGARSATRTRPSRRRSRC